MAGLRQRYAAACREALLLERPPADSLDRWMLEQLAQPRGTGAGDPLLPRPGLAETSRVLLRELLAEVPLRCPSRAWGRPAAEALQRYRLSAQRWIEHRQLPASLRTQVEALSAWLDGRPLAGGAAAARRGPSSCPFRRKLDELSSGGGLSSQLQREVEPLALGVVAAVSAEARAVVEQMQDGAGGEGGEGGEDEASELVLLREEAGPPGGAAVLSCRGDDIRVSQMHLFKLRQLFDAQQRQRGDLAATPGPGQEQAFLRSAYVMLRRYVTFIGLDPAEEGLRGGNMHAAAPESVFAWLKQELGVRCELFASPLNCYFPRFFSAFPDTDAAFGSLGSFFHAKTLPEGSYEVGPPYTEEVLELTAQRLLRLLRAAGATRGALSFVLFVPDWAGCGALELLDGGEFAAYRRGSGRGGGGRGGGGEGFLAARGREHRYITGVQFFADVGEDSARRYYVVPHGTRVYVLQSDAGAARWPFTEAVEHGLLQSMRSGLPP